MGRLLLIFLLIASSAQAETYKWADSEGTVHFSESRGEIPERFRKNAAPVGIETPPQSFDDAKKNPAQKPGEYRKAGDDQKAVAPMVEGLMEQMQKDESTMTLISALQDDPEVQALLSDPAVLRAAQSGDIGTLMANPAVMKILNNPRVREIGKKYGNFGTGEK